MNIEKDSLKTIGMKLIEKGATSSDQATHLVIAKELEVSRSSVYAAACRIGFALSEIKRQRLEIEAKDRKIKDLEFVISCIRASAGMNEASISFADYVTASRPPMDRTEWPKPERSEQDNIQRAIDTVHLLQRSESMSLEDCFC